MRRAPLLIVAFSVVALVLAKRAFDSFVAISPSELSSRPLEAQIPSPSSNPLPSTRRTGVPLSQALPDARKEPLRLTGARKDSKRAQELLYEAALRADPNNWSAYESLGKLLLNQGRAAEAIQLARNCLHNYEESPYCHDILIQGYEARGNDEKVAEAIELCRRNRTGDFYCLMKERDYLLKHGDPEGANAAVERAYTGFANEADRQEVLSRFYSFSGEKDKSREALRQACELGLRDACEQLGQD